MIYDINIEIPSASSISGLHAEMNHKLIDVNLQVIFQEILPLLNHADLLPVKQVCWSLYHSITQNKKLNYIAFASSALNAADKVKFEEVDNKFFQKANLLAYFETKEAINAANRIKDDFNKAEAMINIAHLDLDHDYQIAKDSAPSQISYDLWLQKIAFAELEDTKNIDKTINTALLIDANSEFSNFIYSLLSVLFVDFAKYDAESFKKIAEKIKRLERVNTVVGPNDFDAWVERTIQEPTPYNVRWVGCVRRGSDYSYTDLFNKSSSFLSCNKPQYQKICSILWLAREALHFMR